MPLSNARAPQSTVTQGEGRFVPTQGHLAVWGPVLAPTSARVPSEAAQGFSVPLPLKSEQHRGEMGDEGSDSPQGPAPTSEERRTHRWALRALPGTQRC